MSHPILPEARCKAARIQCLARADYNNYKISIKHSQMLSPQYTLQEISKRNEKRSCEGHTLEGDLLQPRSDDRVLPSSGKYHYATVTSMGEKEVSRSIVESGVFLVVMDRSQSLKAIEMLEEEGNSLCSKELFRWRHVMLQNCMSIRHAEAIEHSTVWNTSNAIAPTDTPFVETMQALLDFAGGFETETRVKLVDAMTKDILDDQKSSDYLPGGKKGTYNQSVPFGKLFINNREVSDPLGALSSEGTSGKYLHISHVSNTVLYVLEPDGWLLLVVAGNVYVFNCTRTPTSHAPSYHRADRTVLMEFHESNRIDAANMYPKFM